MLHTKTIPSPIGFIRIHTTHDKLSRIELRPSTDNDSSIQTAITQHITHELQTYFKNPNHIFNLPIQLQGTPFQMRVWQALQKIPSGKTVTYQMLAEQLQTSPRAIGNACRTNPIPVIIPCHRVVAKNHLGGYSGATNGTWMEIKKWLLAHEEQK
jgi:methylated-DNA-[protein]-cysteine S-methyltransferase